MVDHASCFMVFYSAIVLLSGELITIKRLLVLFCRSHYLIMVISG